MSTAVSSIVLPLIENHLSSFNSINIPKKHNFLCDKDEFIFIPYNDTMNVLIKFKTVIHLSLNHKYLPNNINPHFFACSLCKELNGKRKKKQVLTASFKHHIHTTNEIMTTFIQTYGELTNKKRKILIA